MKTERLLVILIVLTLTENEGWPTPDDLQSLNTQNVNPEDVDRAVQMLDREGRVVLCGPPKSGKSSLGYALLKHYQQKGFAVYYLKKLYSHHVQSLCKGERSFVLMDGGLGVVRVDSDQYDQCESFVSNTRTLRNDRQCLLALTAYPHVLRELAVLESGSSRPLLPSTLRIDVTLPRHGPRSVFTPSAVSYLPLLQRMLHDPITGHAMEVLLVLSLLESGPSALDPPAAKLALQRLEITNVPSYSVKQLAHYLKGFILNDIGSGFPSRLLYDAAGLALGRFCSLSVLLKACDVTFLVQYVRTSGTPTESSIVIDLAAEERQLLMQRMYELIVDGQLQELCQHPSLGCPAFLCDFQAFCTRHENYVQRLVSAVDTEHGLPLLYWSVWNPSGHLARWMMEHFTGAKLLSQSLLSATLAIVLFFTRSDVEARNETKSFLKNLILSNFKPASEETLKLTLPMPRMFATEETGGQFAELKTRLQSPGVCYLDDPSLPIPATLLSVTVTEDAVSVELPSRHWRLVLRLLADGEVDEADDNGNTLLHVAADTGHPQVITIAVKSGASITVTNNKRLTPYHLAQRRRKGKKDISSLHDNNPTHDLHTACSEGDVETVKVFLCQGASLHDKGDNNYTPLHSACCNDQAKVASLLIQLGADIDVKNKSSNSPLHLACRFGHVDTFRLLMEHDADVNTKGGHGLAPVHWACWFGHTEVAKLILQHPAVVDMKNDSGQTALHLACKEGHTDTARLLLQHHAVVDMKNNGGQTALHLACREGHTDTARLLLQHHDVVDMKDSVGHTALHWACREGHTDTARLLLQHHAVVDMKDGGGRTAFHWACKKGNTDTARLLLQHRAVVDLKGGGSYTALHWACMQGHTNTACLLLEHQAVVDLKDVVGHTALHWACREGHTDTVRLLLEHNADTDMKNGVGHTALHWACREGHTDIARLLLQHHAALDLKDGIGHTVFDSARLFGHTDIVRLLEQHLAYSC